MIVLAIETSGLFPEKHGIWQIGALDLANPKNYFLEECRIDDSDLIDSNALKIINKTEEELRDIKKQSQKEMLKKLFAWISNFEMRNCICQNPIFDLSFITQKARKYQIYSNVKHRSFDLHALSASKYFQINKDFLKESDGGSAMRLSTILEFCGLREERKIINSKTGKIEREGKPHNALEDCKLTAECFSRIMFGKKLIPEFSKFEIPTYLKYY